MYSYILHGHKASVEMRASLMFSCCFFRISVASLRSPGRSLSTRNLMMLLAALGTVSQRGRRFRLDLRPRKFSLHGIQMK